MYKYYTSNNNGQDDYGLKYIDDQGYGVICQDYKVEFPNVISLRKIL